MKKELMVVVIAVIFLCGCGKEEKTYGEGLREGFKVGYTEGVYDSDAIAFASGKAVIYADKYGYLFGYHDGILGKKRLTEEEYDIKKLQEEFKTGYEQGYVDAISGEDSLENFGGPLSYTISAQMNLTFSRHLKIQI